MLGSQIGPIVWNLVIRQVARQPLPRVIPEKTYIEVSHCYGQDQDIHSRIFKGLWTVLLSLLQYTCGWTLFAIYSRRLGGAFSGFSAARILASTPVTSVSNAMPPTLRPEQYSPVHKQMAHTSTLPSCQRDS